MQASCHHGNLFHDAEHNKTSRDVWDKTGYLYSQLQHNLFEAIKTSQIHRFLQQDPVVTTLQNAGVTSSPQLPLLFPKAKEGHSSSVSTKNSVMLTQLVLKQTVHLNSMASPHILKDITAWCSQLITESWSFRCHHTSQWLTSESHASGLLNKIPWSNHTFKSQ